MKIAITGASGLVGTRLREVLTNNNHKVVALQRELFEERNFERLTNELSSVHVVINLAGASIFRLWTQSAKQEIRSSRLETTNRLVAAINKCSNIKLLISTSAVGVYPSNGCHFDNSYERGSGFLADICQDWEHAASRVDKSVRLAILRLGVVLSTRGGAFPKMAKGAKLGLNFVVGSTKDFSWIDLEDVVGAIVHIIENQDISGAVNMCAPSSSTMKDLGYKLSRHYSSLLTIAIPPSLIEFIVGEGALLITAAGCGKPQKLLDSGYLFRSPDVDSFLMLIKRKN